MDDMIDKIMNENFLTLQERILNDSIDLVVTSPPYNIGKEYEQKISLEDYLENSRTVIKACTRILKKSGSLFWQVGTYVAENGAHYPLDIMLFPIFYGCGLIPVNRIVWIRQHGTHGKRRFSNRHETVLWFVKSLDHFKFYLDRIRVPQKYPEKKGYARGDKYGELTGHPLGKNPGDVWAFRNVKHNHQEQTTHPCQFPEDMITRIVLATTDEGDIVLDPFMGSGTVAVVAKSANRRYIGSELVKDYVDVANHRISGLPDENNNFPNLKTLRAYVERTGEDISKFTFTRQVAKKPSSAKEAKIYPEHHHLEQTVARIELEAERAQYNQNFTLGEVLDEKKNNMTKKETKTVDLTGFFDG